MLKKINIRLERDEEYINALVTKSKIKINSAAQSQRAKTLKDRLWYTEKRMEFNACWISIKLALGDDVTE